MVEKQIFFFIKCEACHQFFDCPFLPEIQKIIEYYKNLYKVIQRKKLQRAKFENLSSPKKEDLEKYAFFLCYKCKKPYYVGKNNGKNTNYILDKYNNIEKDCLCGKDSFVYIPNSDNICNKHGIDYMEYKCRYCCNMASRFVSQTHYCEGCYFNKKEIKSCDKKNCELGGNHPANGEEFCLGCFACKFNEFIENKKIYPQTTPNNK